MRIVVTGGAGFIGSHIAERYLALGHDVWVLDDLSTGRRENIPVGAQFIAVNVGHHSIQELIREIAPHVINHHAAQIDIRQSVANPRLDIEANILGTLNLLEAGIKAKIERFIFASSGGAVYGEQETFPADERHPTEPVSPYGIDKLAAEKYVQYYARQYGFAPVMFRYANVYGPRQDPGGEAGVVAIFANKLLANQRCTIYGDGRQTRDYVYIADVVDCNVIGLDLRCQGVYNVGTGIETDVNTLYTEITRSIGVDIPPLYDAPRPGEQRRSRLTAERLAREFGWSPRILLREGIRETVRYFLARIQQS